jgi:DnaD/phage-associated family protein
MYFVLQEMQIDLGDTPIENIFINDYMPVADGTYVKVYLMGYKCAKDQSNFNNETIAKQLNLSLTKVLEAWDYWENEGIIKKHVQEDENNYVVEFINLKQLYIDNVYSQIKNNESDEKIHNENIPSGKYSENIKMMQDIEEMFRRPLTINEKQKINKWLSIYKMKAGMMTQVFSYCINNKKTKRFSSIEYVLKEWYDQGVNDIDTMVEYLEKKNDRFSIYSRISKYLGIYKPLDEPAMRIVDKWIDDWGFSMEMILKCLDKSVNTLNPNFKYFDSILERWHEKGFKIVEDLKNDIKPETKRKKPVNSSAGSKNKFHNFDQKIKDYSEEELEKIAKKRLEKKLNKLGLSEEGDDKN